MFLNPLDAKKLLLLADIKFDLKFTHITQCNTYGYKNTNFFQKKNRKLTNYLAISWFEDHKPNIL